MPSRRRSYLIQYRALGRSRRYPIGAHGVWTPDAARKEALFQLGRAAKGDNPAEERKLDHIRRAPLQSSRRSRSVQACEAVSRRPCAAGIRLAPRGGPLWRCPLVPR
ncbi:MAG: DUF4102 domain-containing protein [Proteobacteria bacterium]|nr:DUF4102 domain-containing protein [Pseudomonadota bacterium]